MTQTKKDKPPLTPMMQQYCSLKEQYPDVLLLYRLGDFYELFFNDAEVVSKELGLVLTKRVDAPMCGIPWHASEMYITKLVKNGHRVAICEQTETPEEAKKRGNSKAPLERQVVRIITKGTLIEQEMLSEKSNNYLLAISNCCDGKLAMAYADVSTGRFVVDEVAVGELLSTISKIAPAEIICSDNLLSHQEVLEALGEYKSIIRAVPNSKFSQSSAKDHLAKFFGVKFIDAFGAFSKQAAEAAAAVVGYISEVYKSDELNLSFPKITNRSDYMTLDNFTRRSLELTASQRGGRKGSLLAEIDYTKTSQGGRMLARWLVEPLVNIGKINRRLDFVEFFAKNSDVLRIVSTALSNFPDVERSISRVLLNKAGPRDLKCICAGLKTAEKLGAYLDRFEALQNIKLQFDGMEGIAQTLEKALTEDVPVLARDGGFIRRGYDQELDEYVNILENSEDIVKALQTKYVEETGIKNLKVKNNAVIGYFIEIPPSAASKMPSDFIHRQSLAACMRYTSDELLDIANKIYSAESNAKRRELAIFGALVDMIAVQKDGIRRLSDNVSFLDVCSAFAQMANEKGYVRPELTDDRIFDIKNGRHPVVENSLRSGGVDFVANDCSFSEDRFVSILTGPNMGGKSTYLRQNAIIIIMAQIGSFVPADYAKIGVVDRIFSRVGASDDIASGRSTFMVEMLETATILQHATERSFIILDEVGRGTSTYDGLAIAWAVVEDIATRIRARTIFATHYHELKELQNLPQLDFLTVKVEEWNGKIMFLHKIKSGFADKSYGINVAALAGFPKNVLDRAEEVLTKLT
ncbi:MAG: DNA mismatch repair protein MutS [Alphaproteobacteria bacterium]|nr:DNA mismatch repair protein MutS [Alphaproteobacteria bacterium]